jgi:hypothetical protein
MVFLSRSTLKVGYVTAYWGAKPKKAKLTGYSNSQVRRLQDGLKPVLPLHSRIIILRPWKTR